MANYNLRRFGNVEGLKASSVENLMNLFRPYESYFQSRGFSLNGGSQNDIDYESLVNILMNPESDIPPDLVDNLYFINEMATDEGMDTLLQEAKAKRIDLEDCIEPTPADVAVQIFLKDRNLLERKHAEQYVKKYRSFEYFHTNVSPIPDFKDPTPDQLEALQEELDDWFEEKKRGRGSRVFVFNQDDGIWFLVRHGDPYKREGSLNGNKSSSVFYRPEKFDVLVYDQSIGEIRMKTCSKGEKETLRTLFGRHLFGNDDFFPDSKKYTLEPLREEGLLSMVCTDVDGMEWVRLKEIQFYWGGAESEIEIRKANDLFAAYESRDRSLPEKGRMIRASFLVKFEDSKTARTIVIKPPNVAQYTRDSDAETVEKWLIQRGFIINEQEQTVESVLESLASF